MISLESSGSFKKTESFLRKMQNLNIRPLLEAAGKAGVQALAAATPVDSGIAANSWYYQVIKDRNGYTIQWCNSDIENGFPVAVMIQYGHGTGTGGYVPGRDYINPAIKPIFDSVSAKTWKVVTTA